MEFFSVILREGCRSRRISRGPRRVNPAVLRYPEPQLRRVGEALFFFYHSERRLPEPRDPGSLCAETLATCAQKDRGPSTRAALAQDDRRRNFRSINSLAEKAPAAYLAALSE